MHFTEPLEQRRLFSATPFALGDAEASEPLSPGAPAPGSVAGPRLTDFRVIGGPLGVAGIRLTFDGPLDPERARREGNYVLRGDFTSRDLRDTPVDFDDDEFFNNGDNERGRFNEVPVEEATHDAAARTVTLRVRHPFLLSHLRVIYVRSGPDGLRDLAGNFLDGDHDGQAGGIGALRVRTTRGTGVRYFDADGDRVRLRLRGPGRLFVFRHITSGGEGRRPGNAVQVWLSGRSTPRSVLSGTVTPSRRGGDGRSPIAEILRPEEARIDLLSDPAFQVGTVTA